MKILRKQLKNRKIIPVCKIKVSQEAKKYDQLNILKHKYGLNNFKKE